MSPSTPHPTPIEGSLRVAPRHSAIPRRVTDIASRQDGLITTTQLHAAGADGPQIRRWVKLGWLHPRHRTVFSVGHRAWTARAHRRAALLAAGSGAVLSHRSAAVHLGLVDWRLDVVDIMVPRTGNRGRTGIVFHRPRAFRQDVVAVDGLRCTSVARTIVDLAALLSLRSLHQVIEKAVARRLLDIDAVADVLARTARPRGVRKLRRCLSPELGHDLTESLLERTYLRLISEARVPTPVQQARMHLEGERIRVDFLWPSVQCVVEVDGPHHALPLRAAQDARRDALLARHGFHVAHITHAEIDGDPTVVVARTRLLLASRDRCGWGGHGDASGDGPD